MTTITFDKNKKKQLRKAYNKAINSGNSIFFFEDQELLVSYTKYLLEHLDNVIK